jgi:hypothetical protein
MFIVYMCTVPSFFQNNSNAAALFTTIESEVIDCERFAAESDYFQDGGSAAVA